MAPTGCDGTGCVDEPLNAAGSNHQPAAWNRLRCPHPTSQPGEGRGLSLPSPIKPDPVSKATPPPPPPPHPTPPVFPAMYDEIPDYRYRLIDYVGDGIVLGALIGSPYYFIRGLCNSMPSARTGAGLLAVFWALESGMSLARRRREDKWNLIAAGTGTYALVNVRRGARAAARSSLLASMFYVGISLAGLGFAAWHSGVGGLPALVPSRRVSPCRAALRDAAEGSLHTHRIAALLHPPPHAIPDLAPIWQRGGKPLDLCRQPPLFSPAHSLSAMSLLLLASPSRT
ncbi:hypothetical protein HU200_035933 [Digitaria exilis]|uniref:Uncharacterized protein n=1 Tax=Digitaria exilis TaxID=1010633 RepID=A0A835EIH8_9POAL|nr:hypothetical protein HU200_035933 [Digitaria exilis]